MHVVCHVRCGVCKYVHVICVYAVCTYVYVHVGCGGCLVCARARGAAVCGGCVREARRSQAPAAGGSVCGEDENEARRAIIFQRPGLGSRPLTESAANGHQDAEGLFSSGPGLHHSYLSMGRKHYFSSLCKHSG